MPPQRDALLADMPEPTDCVAADDRVDAETIDAAPRLRAVADYAIGFDDMNIEAATARGVARSATRTTS